MEKLIDILILISCVVFKPVLVEALCPNAYLNIAGGCFQVFDTVEASFTQAQALCQAIDGDLAIINNCNLLTGLVDYFIAVNLQVTGLWIGGSDVNGNGRWKWSNGSNVPMGAPFWGRKNASRFNLQPDGSANQDCLAMTSGGGYYFQDKACNSKMTPICQRTPEINGTCSKPYEAVGGSCFTYKSSLKQTWTDARKTCRKSYGDLAVLDDCQLMSDLIVKLSTTGNYWIGGSDLKQEGLWRWITGSRMRMKVPFWGRDGSSSVLPSTDYKDDRCLQLSPLDQFLFNDECCSAGFAVLCQAAPLDEIPEVIPYSDPDPEGVHHSDHEDLQYSDYVQ